MRTTMKIMTYAFIGISIIATSCQKDSLEETVLPQAVQSEQNESGTNSNGVTNGTNGTDGANGADGKKGETGAQGPAGTDGVDGQDGATGPKGDTGEPGPAGVDGINGEDGENGSDGKDGNANVIASEWLEPIESSYTCCNSKYKALVLATGIKAKVKEGVILVYYDNDIQVQLLPRYIVNTSSGSIQKSVDSHINHASNTLSVAIRKYDTDLTSREYTWNSSGPAYAKGVRFKYIIIPEATSSKNNAPNFKKMSYQEVMDHFGFDY